MKIMFEWSGTTEDSYARGNFVSAMIGAGGSCLKGLKVRVYGAAEDDVRSD